jgi:histidyl-tRNA synthetase
LLLVNSEVGDGLGEKNEYLVDGVDNNDVDEEEACIELEMTMESKRKRKVKWKDPDDWKRWKMEMIFDMDTPEDERLLESHEIKLETVEEYGGISNLEVQDLISTSLTSIALGGLCEGVSPYNSTDICDVAYDNMMEMELRYWESELSQLDSLFGLH